MCKKNKSNRFPKEKHLQDLVRHWNSNEHFSIETAMILSQLLSEKEEWLRKNAKIRNNSS